MEHLILGPIGLTSAASKQSGAGTAPPRLTTSDADCRADLRYWVGVDRKTALRVLDLVEAMMREAFGGLGEPEPLKRLIPGIRSRRITARRSRNQREAFLPS